MPIDINKMKFGNSSRIKLADNIFESYMQNAYDYFTVLAKNIGKVNPNNAVDVIPALSAFKEYFVSESEWERLTLYSLNTLRKGIQRSHFDKIAVFSGMTHVAFSVYDLSIKVPKVNPFLMEINEILLNNLSAFLDSSNKKEFKSAGNYEVIKGLSGPLRYLLSFDNDDKMKNMAERIVNVFIERSKDISIEGHTVPGWHYYPSEVEKAYSPIGALNGCINYGVSHGMGGPLVTLSLAYSRGICTDDLGDVISRLVSEYMNALYYVNDIAYWPSKISFEEYVLLEQQEKGPRQMSWCYGSVGILRALYIAGILTCNDEVARFALDELVKIAKMDLSDYLLSQPIVCHGFIGTAAIINLMYLETGKVEFLQRTTEMVEVSATIGIERFFDIEKLKSKETGTPFKEDLHGHLEGYNGIIQTVLSVIKGCPTGNEKRLSML